MSLGQNNNSRFSINQRFLIFLLTFCLIFNVIKAYKSGAPTFTCESMTPQHDDAVAQNGPSPFVTTPDQFEIPFDGNISLTISSVDPQLNKTFKGFLVVATVPEEGDRIVGMFNNFNGGKVIECDLGDSIILPNSAACHSNKNEKSNVTVNWFPNGFTGNIVFKMTYVEDKNIFWVKDQTATIRVLEPEITTPEVSSSTESNSSSSISSEETSSSSEASEMSSETTESITDDITSDSSDSTAVTAGPLLLLTSFTVIIGQKLSIK